MPYYNENVNYISFDESILDFKRNFNDSNANNMTIENINVFPNPANNLLHIQLNYNSFNSYYTYLKIIDIGGKEIINTEIKNSYLTIDVSDIKSGFYIIEILSIDGYKRCKKLNIYH